MSSNNFDRDILKYIWGEHPPIYLHWIGIGDEGLPDAFHHIKGRAKQNETLSSIFNALPVNNAKHLQFHGKLKVNALLFLNLVAKDLLHRLKTLADNDLMFRMDKVITETDKAFINENLELYTPELQTQLKELC